MASWRGRRGRPSTSARKSASLLACAPPGWSPGSAVDPAKLGASELIDGLCGPNAAARFHCQREILRRGRSAETTRALTELSFDESKPIHARVAALFALKQLDGTGSHAVLRKLVGCEPLREFALEALADRKTQLAGVDPAPFRKALADPSPRVRGAALVGLARLGDIAAAAAIIPLTSRPEGSPMPARKPVNAQPDPDRAIPHLAVRALVSAARGRCLRRRDRRPASRGGAPCLAVDARSEGGRWAHQETLHGPFARIAQGHPDHAGAAVSPRG